MADRPTGTVTFLFTDIEGSTRTWEREPEAMAGAVATHDEIVRGAIGREDGYVFATGGDSFSAAFVTAAAALSAATGAQAALEREEWDTKRPIRVRMGLHTASAEERDGNYFGPEVNRVARLAACGHGGQVLVSSTTASLLDDTTKLVSLGEHRLADIDRPERLAQVGQGAFPPLRAMAFFRCNLPDSRSALIGRDSELADVQRLLRSSRLVTLSGAGGAGKTRLALEAARDAVAAFENGVWFIDLAAVAEPAAGAAAVADGVEVPHGQDPLGAIIEAVGSRELLLVADNCEHVIDAAADLIDALLAGCSGMVVLATSRESLEIEGESVYPVPPLDPGGAAMDLFWIRAADAGVTREAFDEDQVRALCTRLDGLPLAVELAAARARTLRPADLIAHLDEGGDLVGRRRGRRRHETLQGTMEWSFRLLDPAEQLVLRRLSVFEGDFSLDGASTVAEMPRAPTADMMDALVAKSLVLSVPPPIDDGRSWFRLLETVRDFTARELVEGGERQRALDLLVDYVLQLGEAWANSDDRIHDFYRPSVAQRATVETALRHATERDDPLAAVQILHLMSIVWLFEQTGFGTTAAEQLSDHLDTADLQDDWAGPLLVRAAQISLGRLEIDRALDYSGRARRLADGRPTPYRAVALSQHALMTAYIDPIEATRYADRALATLTEALSSHVEQPLSVPGLLRVDEGEVSAWVRWNYAEVLGSNGDPEAAIASLREVIDAGFDRAGNFYFQCQDTLVWNMILLGRADEAPEIVAGRDRSQLGGGRFDVAKWVGVAAAGDPDHAERALLAVAEGEPYPNEILANTLLTGLGIIAFHAGSHDRAKRLLTSPRTLPLTLSILVRSYLARLDGPASSGAILDSPADVRSDIAVARRQVRDELEISRQRLATAVR